MTVADYDLLRQVWRQAHALPEGVRIECPTPQAAVSMRFALYNSVKKYRNEVHAQAADEALITAIRACSAVIERDAPCVVVVQRKGASGMSELVKAALGMPAGADAVSPENLKAEESLQRLQQMGVVEKPADAPADGTRVTPYYTREE